MLLDSWNGNSSLQNLNVKWFSKQLYPLLPGGEQKIITGMNCYINANLF
jgi:hypothetical protein